MIRKENSLARATFLIFYGSKYYYETGNTFYVRKNLLLLSFLRSDFLTI